MTIQLSQELYEALQEIARRRGVDVADAIRAAIGSDLFILRETANGSKILVKRSDASLNELVINGG